MWLSLANQRWGCGSGGVASHRDGGVRALGRVRGRRAHGRGARSGAAAGRYGMGDDRRAGDTLEGEGTWG